MAVARERVHPLKRGDFMDKYHCNHEGTPYEHAKPYHLDYKFGPGHNAALCLVCGRMMVKGEGETH